MTICHKRDGEELSDREIREFIQGVCQADIPDYQTTAFLMAVYFKGMTLDETAALTDAMLGSGIRQNLSAIKGVKIDKHSTGGVGDKVSLILAPLAAACGIKVPMMAGRGLGHSGGTLDKLESISGFNVQPSAERFSEILGSVGCAIIGQSEKIVPADRKLYALRDVTGTVECIPLIVASILSKKLAAGAEGLVMDVKVGSGAFMKTREQARRLARTLIQVAHRMGLPCRALLTDMNQPLGHTAGNALEVAECVNLLRNGKNDEGSSGDLKELAVQLCAQMLVLGRLARNLTEGRKLAHNRLADGSAWKHFQEMVRAQGGRLDQVLDPSLLPRASHVATWKSRRRGYLTRMDTEAIGRILVELGAGRLRSSDRVDHGVGMVFHRKLGARVQAGEPLVAVHHAGDPGLDALEERFHAALEISGARKPVPKLILEQIQEQI